MDARALEARETVSASKKLGRDDAAAMLASASRLVVAKGKKVLEFVLDKGVPDEAVDAMLGPTGNLRAPTVRFGKTIVVGYDDELYAEIFG
jgi:hypothetical protein